MAVGTETSGHSGRAAITAKVKTTSRQLWILLYVFVCFLSEKTISADDPVKVDSQTLHHKVLCGFQGWFRCPDDSARQGWRYWRRNGRRITPEFYWRQFSAAADLGVEMTYVAMSSRPESANLVSEIPQQSSGR